MRSETLYDHPLYYDILFGWDRAPEADFYDAVFQHCGVENTERLLEVACGSGQVTRLLARRGWSLVAIDSREAMVEFLRRQATAEGVAVDAVCADMSTFCGDGPFGGAFNPMSSFRLLHSDDLAASHLRAMASCLRPGGIYVLDLEFAAPDAPNVTTDEEWEMSRGGITVRARNDAVHVDHAGEKRTLHWGEEIHLRNLLPEQFEACVATTGGFEIESLHPESDRNAEGVSVFDVNHRIPKATDGRALVVLRRA